MRSDVKKLYRCVDEGRVAGICAGLGEYVSIDPVVIRLGWVAVTVMTGIVPGALASRGMDHRSAGAGFLASRPFRLRGRRGDQVALRQGCAPPVYFGPQFARVGSGPMLVRRTMMEIPTPRTLATLALSALAVCGCATRTVQPALLPAATLPEEQAVAVDQSPAVEDLYARAQRAEDDYREAVDSLAAGDEVIGEEQIVVVTREINRITEECARTRGCDLGPVLAVFDRLIGEQEITLKSQAARIRALEASLEDEGDPWREPGTSPFVAAIPELGRTDRLLHGADLREIITLNAPVDAALDDWLTWMRPMLMDSYENYQYLRDEIAPVYEDAGLPEALLFAMIATESGGKVHSYSSAGAVGLLQFMRHTGRTYGLKQVDGFDGRLDPVAATRANVAYLNKRFSELNNSLEKALAAYNGGEGRMRTLNRRHKGASLWDNRIYYSLRRLVSYATQPEPAAGARRPDRGRGVDSCPGGRRRSLPGALPRRRGRRSCA